MPMRQPSPNILRAAHGFTLVEAMIAVAVLLLGVLALEKNFTAQTMNNNSTKLVSGGVASASSFLETLRTLPLNNAQLQDADGNMQVDLLKNGGNCANLDATINASGNVLADHAVNWDEGRNTSFFFFQPGNQLVPHGLFTLFWNVCENPNVAGTRQIRVIIRWHDNNRINNVNDGDPRNNQQVVMNYVRGNL